VKPVGVEERLERAEAAVAHLERQYDELNAVVIAQTREIERLRRSLERLGETLETQELDRIRSTQTKPPHYSV
jgi:uncharacterized coiled-coil protein SlyX